MISIKKFILENKKKNKEEIQKEIGISLTDQLLNGNTERVMNEVKDHFRPEFINRIDEIVIFDALSKDTIYKILDKIISDIEKRLVNINLKIELTDNCKNELVNTGYDINFGARPLKRVVSREIETIISEHIINGDIKYNDTVIIDYRNGNYTINRK